MEKFDKENFVRVEDVTDPKLKAELLLMCATYGMVSHADFIKARCYDLADEMRRVNEYRHKQKVYMKKIMEEMYDYQRTIGRCFKDKEQFLFEFNDRFEELLMPIYQWLEYQCASTLYIMREGFDKFRSLPEREEPFVIGKEKNLMRVIDDARMLFVGKVVALLICVELSNLCHFEIMKNKKLYGTDIEGAHWLAFPRTERWLNQLSELYVKRTEILEMANRHGVEKAMLDLKNLLLDTEILSECINSSEILEV